MPAWITRTGRRRLAAFMGVVALLNLAGWGLFVHYSHAYPAINLIVLLDILRISRELRHGHYDRERLENRLLERAWSCCCSQ